MSQIITYELDLTGRKTDNLVTRDPYPLVTHAGLSQRVIVTNYGGFYTQGLQIEDVDGNVLEPYVDYVATYLYQSVSDRTGREVAGAIVILNQSLSGLVYLTYQTVGGDVAFNLDAQQEVIDAITARPGEDVLWGDFIGEPTPYGPGELQNDIRVEADHRELVVKIQEVIDANLHGDQEAIQALKDHISARYRAIEETFAVGDAIPDHIADDDNPHELTKEIIGLSNLENYATATMEEEIAGSRTDVYSTVAGALTILNEIVVSQLANHETDTNNPHNLTAADVDSYTRSEFDTLIEEVLTIVEKAPNANVILNVDTPYTATDMIQQARQNLNAITFTQGTIAPELLGGMSPSSDKMLFAIENGVVEWRLPSQIFNLYPRNNRPTLGMVNENNPTAYIASEFTNTGQHPIWEVASYIDSLDVSYVGIGSVPIRFIGFAYRTGTNWDFSNF